MKVVVGDIFKPDCCVRGIAITTNSIIKKNGEAVMGAGIALAAKKLWPNLPNLLAESIRKGKPTNRIAVVIHNETPLSILSFQTKEDWKNPSTIEIIQRSCKAIMEAVDSLGWTEEGCIWLPIPGCNNGGLQWPIVYDAIKNLLDDRFCVVTRKKG